VISYTVTVSRDVVETTVVNVTAANENDAVEQALIVALGGPPDCKGRLLDWERQDLTYSPNPYATVYDVVEQG
jgi:hypothetical protein